MTAEFTNSGLGGIWSSIIHANHKMTDEQARIQELEANEATLRAEIARLRADNERMQAALQRPSPQAEKLIEALTPSAETKGAYMGEFSMPFPVLDENGDERMMRPNIPWTTIKEIMAAIRARADMGAS